MIPFIMWSFAMMITGATVATWFHTKKSKFTSGSGVFTPPKDWKLMSVEVRGGGGGGSGSGSGFIKVSRAEDIPKETYSVEEHYK